MTKKEVVSLEASAAVILRDVRITMRHSRGAFICPMLIRSAACGTSERRLWEIWRKAPGVRHPSFSSPSFRLSLFTRDENGSFGVVADKSREKEGFSAYANERLLISFGYLVSIYFWIFVMPEVTACLSSSCRFVFLIYICKFKYVKC